MEDVLACRVDECISEGVPHGVGVHLVSLNISVKSLRRFIIHHLQKHTRQAYWRYIEGIITPDDLDRPYTGMKKFWTYIKHRRKDNPGTPLYTAGV
jgi:uncharacterized short protein YbdD (DUF466 family)